ncbi:MAG: anti-sigma factor [Variibacter sp.]
MSEEDDDKDVLAAEFVLGTLEGDDRTNALMLLSLDPGFAATIAKWERRLGELNVLVESVEPPKDTWEWIKVRIAGVKPSGQMWLPGVNDPPPAAAAPAAPAAAPAPAPMGAAATEAQSAEIVVLAQRVRRWRGLGMTFGAVAAALLAVVVARDIRPDLLPEALRPVPQVVEKRVEVVRNVEVPSQKMAEYVAILQKDSASPAFLMTIDLDKRTLSVRKVGAPAQAGKDYELWLVSAHYPAPQSLGVIGEGEFTVRRNLASYDSPTLKDATFAVSIEPTGGSPTGKPSGPPVFTGKLMQATPPAFPSQTP